MAMPVIDYNMKEVNLSDIYFRKVEKYIGENWFDGDRLMIVLIL
jgi:hypothetical protein